MKKLYVEFADFDENDNRVTRTEYFDPATLGIDATTGSVINVYDNTHEVYLSMDNVLFFELVDAELEAGAA